MNSFICENRLIVSIIVILAIFGLCYYFFIDTLSLSEIMPKSDNFFVTASVAIFDFDTGLTRYDIYRLQKIVPLYDKQMAAIAAISNPRMRKQAEEKLMNEMLQDPSFRKIFQKVGRIIGKTGTSLFKMLSEITLK